MAFDGNEGKPISLEQAISWTSSFQKKMSLGQLNSQFYGKNAIMSILKQEGCVGIRFYHGINDSGENVIILVGADANENDMTSGLIYQDGTKCPPRCSKSALSGK